ncbi:MAG: inositol monophosphatase, partial [Candidatus Marinimicrobia bacterium]|nr:inositol monophosphatase [Candidatus Neomarinimicrobiota bacterium]
MKNKYLDIALTAAQDASLIILNALDKPRAYSHKGVTDLVTITDQQSEDCIIGMIHKYFPDHAILAEESGQHKSDSQYLWIIDPLDGTTNFIHGYPSFSVSIALFINEKPYLGVVIEMPSNNMYYAVKNEGAFKNNSPISVSKIDDITKSLLVTGFGYEHGEKWHKNMELFKYYTDITQGVRRLGAASVDLCHLACGQVDGFWEFDLHPWDTAAGILIVEEAGGNVTGMNGENYS